MKNKSLLLILSLFVASCSTKKEIVYFQGVEELNNLERPLEFQPIFEVNDVLQIQVSSITPEVVAPFQMNMAAQSSGIGGSSSSSGSSRGSSGGRNSASFGYLVDIDGNIQFPVLGKVPVAGKTRSEVEAYLTNILREQYVKDAVVAVRLVNFRVTVLGEAGSQTVVQVENERISVPELFASVGGITYDGRRDNVKVIREMDGVITVGNIDMTSAEVFKSPYFYLRQNDIVYVEPTYKQVKAAGWITSPMGLISMGTTIFSLIVLFTR